jgi:hypothetical protein
VGFSTNIYGKQSGLDKESRLPAPLITWKQSLAMESLEAERVADPDEIIHGGPA